MPTDIPISVSDSLALSDAIATANGVPRSAVDSLALSDNLSYVISIPINVSDQLSLVDAILVTNNIGLIESGIVSLSIDQVIGALGATVIVSIHIIVSGNAFPSALQWALQYDHANLTINSATIGTAGTTAGKELDTIGDNMLVFGHNSNIIASGILATVSFTIPLTAPTNPTPLNIIGLLVATETDQVITGTTDNTVLFSDALQLSDSINVLLDLQLKISDTLSLSDSIAISGPPISDIRVFVGDTLSLNDSIAALALSGDIRINVNDTLSFSDSILTAVTNLGILDIQRIVTDALSLNDLITGLMITNIGILNIQRTAVDTLSLSDSIQVIQPPMGDSGLFINYIRRYLNDVP